jgi:molecular chaperone DnaK
VPQIEVTFDIDANGILNVSARDKATGKQQNITITASSGLSKEEIDRMKREAETNAADDARQRESIEVKNQGDSTVYNTEKMLRDYGDKVDATDKQAAETALTELREALKTDDLERIKKSQEAVTQASHKLAEAMYKDVQAKTQPGAAGAPQPGAAADGGAPKGDVVDAEFEDLGEKK